MSAPRRYDSTETLVIDRAVLERAQEATRSDDAFEEWAAEEVQRAILSSSPPPPME